MNRWHVDTCLEPDVSAGPGGQPACKSCGASSAKLFETLKVTAAAKDSFPPAIPDEPPGRLNLSWPEAVPYIKSESMPEGVRRSGDGRPKEQSTERETSSIASAPVHGLSLMEKCAIYPESLDPEQFRLACISPAVDHDSAIHISLETYVHDDCPEYEATSYTWGGESNVSTP